MRTQYRKNMRITQLEVFKTQKNKSQAEMMEDIIVIDRDSCLFCTMLLFALLFSVLSLYSFRFSIYSTLDVKANLLSKKLEKYEGKILNMSNTTEIQKNKVLPDNIKKIFASRCFTIFKYVKENSTILNKEIKVELQTGKQGFKNLDKIDDVHFVTLYKISMDLGDKAMPELMYNITNFKENEKHFVKFEAPGITLTGNLDICVLVSGLARK